MIASHLIRLSGIYIKDILDNQTVLGVFGRILGNSEILQRLDITADVCIRFCYLVFIDHDRKIIRSIKLFIAIQSHADLIAPGCRLICEETYHPVRKRLLFGCESVCDGFYITRSDRYRYICLHNFKKFLTFYRDLPLNSLCADSPQLIIQMFPSLRTFI